MGQWSSRRLLVFVAILSFFTLVAADVFAQRSVGADIAGVVKDETGAVLPGVSVTVTSNSTGVSRSLVTDEKGNFLALNLQSGSYTVKAELAGFTPVTLTKVTITLGERANLSVRMNVGTVSESVMVTGESAMVVDTTKTNMSTLVSEKQLTDLPINVRNPLQFILTAPATTPQRTTTGSGYSFGGTRARSNLAIVDGVDNNDDATRSFMAQPNLDAVKEFQVLASNYSAEFGRASGGVVNTILKSGTNNFEGSASFYFRDQSLMATPYFTKLAGNKTPPYSQRQPGATIGGPIVKSKLFFFTSYELFQTDAFNNVTISQKNTDIMNAVLSGNYDKLPALGVAIGPNYPRGITYGYTSVGGPGTFPTATKRHGLIEKVDWQASQNDSFYIRYLYSRSRTRGSGSGLNDFTRAGTAGLNDTHAVVGSYSRIFSSSMLSETRFQYSTYTSGGMLGDSIGPGINISGVGNFGRNLNQPQGRSQNRYQFIDTFSKSSGIHELKFGLDINRVNLVSSLPGTNAGPLGGLGGVFSFSNMAVFLDGNSNNFLQGFGSSGTDQTYTTYGFFVQDNLKPTSKMSLSFGVRYDLSVNPHVANMLDPTPVRIHTDKNNIAPRLGFSYNPDGRGKTVVRAGYGIYYDMLLTNMASNAGQFNGLTVKTITMTGAAAAARFRGQNLGFPPGALPNVPPPAGYGYTIWTSPSPIPDSAFPLQSITTMDPNLPVPYTHQAHVTLEHAVTRDLAVSVGYMMNRAKALPALVNLNLPPPTVDASGRNIYNLSQRTSELPDKRILINNEFQPLAYSSYDALILTVKQRFNRGIQFSASYTLSKAKDLVPDPIFDNPSTSDQLNPAQDWGSSMQDERHRFVFNGVFMTPSGTGLLGRVLGDISFSPIVTIGSPFFGNIVVGGDTNGDGVQNDRPIGAGRNTYALDSNSQVDLRISKSVKLHGRNEIQVLVDGFNIFNTVNFSSYNMTWGSGAYPSTPVATFGQPTGAGALRIVQVGVRYRF